MKAPPCANCGKPLPHYQWALTTNCPSIWGYMGNGVFCTLRCGYGYGLRAQRVQATIAAKQQKEQPK